MSGLCPECSARVRSDGSCRDNFDALLALEWDVPGGAGDLAHFYMVSSYILQHPESMSCTAESLAWVRTAVASALAGGTSPESLRRSARQDGKVLGHVTRRPGDPIPRWAVNQWSMTVGEVLAGGVDGYAGRMETWARSVITDLDSSEHVQRKTASRSKRCDDGRGVT